MTSTIRAKGFLAARGRWLVVVVLSATVATMGCSGGSKPKTIPVKGKVTLAGQPLTQGSLTFQPIKTAEGYPTRPAMGTVNSDGTYEASTFEKGDGVIPGEYKVLVSTMTSGPTLEEPNLPEVWAAPKTYSDPAQSPLKATVPADHSGTLELDFDLQK